MKLKYKIALAQTTPKTAETKLNREKMLQYVQDAAQQGAKLIAFPELALTGYNCGDRFFEIAEQIPGESTLLFVEAAKKYGIYIVWGMVEHGIAGLLYNVAVIVGPEGYVGKWRKHTLPGHAT